jgi:hypothetical protein
MEFDTKWASLVDMLTQAFGPKVFHLLGDLAENDWQKVGVH